MSKIFSIMRIEIYALISRKSFWFATVGVPLLGFIIYAGIAWINQSVDVSSTAGSAIQGLLSQPDDDRPQGYVDLSKIIKAYPDDFDPGSMIVYTNEDEARADLDSGKTSAYYVVQPDYIQTGQIDVYSEEFNLLSSQDRLGELENLLNYNLLSGDERAQEMITYPLSDLQFEDLTPSSKPDRDFGNGWTFAIPYAVIMALYVSIMGSSSLLLNSMTKEKENRILEIIMISANSRQLLFGKMIGLGLVGLSQVLIWGVSAFTLLRLSGQTFTLPPDLAMDPSILLWGILFFVLGYLIYAALMAGIGAMVPGLREASQATTIVVLPMMIPMFLITALIDKPNGSIATVLSLFPLTSPTTMMMRLAATSDVPLWQILLAIGLLVATAYFVIHAVAGIFKSQTMLSGQPFKTRRFLLALIGK